MRWGSEAEETGLRILAHNASPSDKTKSGQRRLGGEQLQYAINEDGTFIRGDRFRKEVGVCKVQQQARRTRQSAGTAAMEQAIVEGALQPSKEDGKGSDTGVVAPAPSYGVR